MTALHIAAQGGHAETVRALLEAGAARDIQDEYGRTPYHAATQQDVSQYLSGSIDLGISSQVSSTGD